MKTITESGHHKKPSSTDVARLAGVSQATVSRVLSGAPHVSQRTRDRVLRVVQDSGYQPSFAARAMRTQKAGVVGVAVSRITNPVVPEILEALALRFSDLGCRTVVWNTEIEGSRAVVDAMLQGAIDGLICTAASHQADAISAALDRNFPVVSLNREIEGADCDQIVSTNRAGAARVAAYLGNHGRSSIAFINGPRDRSTLAEREAGFVEELNRRGVNLATDRRVEVPVFGDGFAEAAISMATSANPPDAIACGNDVAAIGVLNGLRRIGVRVPDDIWVTGFDGIAMSGWDIVDLTTMRQPIEVMASDAAEALLRRIEGKFQEPRVIQYRTEMIVRGSTAHKEEREQTISREET